MGGRCVTPNLSFGREGAGETGQDEKRNEKEDARLTFRRLKARKGRPHLSRRFPDIFLRRRRNSVADVVGDASGEKHRLLVHNPNLRAVEPLQSQHIYIHTSIGTIC